MKITQQTDDTGALNLIWITDIHLSDRPPGRRSERYREQIFDKLKQVRDLCVKHNALCLVGGDVFHIKTPKSPANSLSMIREAIEVFGSFPGGCVYGCVGNHDIQFDRMDTLSHQPLGILEEAGVYRVIDKSLIIEAGGSDWKIQVDAWDFMDQEQTYAALKTSGPYPDDTAYRIGLVHASGCTGDTREFFGTNIIGYNQLRNLDYDFLLWGHDHTRTETETCGFVTHINLGSLSRAALSMDEADRPVSAVLLHLGENNAKVKEIPLKVVTLEQAFRIEDKRVLDVKETSEMKEFFSDLSESVDEIESTDPITVIDALCKEDTKLNAHIKELCNL